MIGRLTNENELVDRKANFFVDYFYLYLSQLGRNIDFELETPLALTDKILYQLKNNFSNCEIAVRSYLLHPMLADEDVYLSQFQTYAPVRQLFNDWLSIEKKGGKPKKALTDNYQNWVSLISAFREELNAAMFTYSLNCIISYLVCPCPLEKHREGIKAYTRILVSECIFLGRRKEFVGSVFGRILDSDINTYPFPSHITTIEEKQSYLQNRTLQQQFSAIEDFMKLPVYKVSYYYKVFGMSLARNVKFRYNEVEFFSRGHKDLTKHRKECPYFFKGTSNFFITKVTVDYYDSETAIVDVRSQIKQELKFVTMKLDREFALDSQYNYIIENGEYIADAFSSRNFKAHESKTILEKINLNPFQALANVNSVAKGHFLSFESLYVSAHAENSVPGYWHYLETLMQDYKRENELMEKVSVIMLTGDLPTRTGIFIEEMSKAIHFFNMPFNRVTFTLQESQAMIKEILDGKVPDQLRLESYPFIQELIAYYDYKLTAKDYEKSAQYYKQILQEAYSQRNFYLHQGSSSVKSQMKLRYSFVTLIQRFRLLLIEELKENAGLEFSTLIDKLYQRGSLLLKYRASNA
ncbi:hypothetical protein SAMN05444410_10877 [Hydrobacter penzbergensis]|uniref:Uncharacterized protein n=1 Tax=Hydrobacter penzbergensis TaxID=1235997 RepID=A0A8X8IHK9_9BACT|nr:hypothetical protein [Hydrobacter penzbergensis]SDX02846.1 hypothetical protein SAMN05444410_10877 [Hydrobacter penzbergensis]